MRNRVKKLLFLGTLLVSSILSLAIAQQPSQIRAAVPPRIFNLNLMVDRSQSIHHRPWAYTIRATNWKRPYVLNKQSFKSDVFIENIDHSHPFYWLDNELKEPYSQGIWLGQCPSCMKHAYWTVDNQEAKQSGYIQTSNCTTTHYQCDAGESCKQTYPKQNWRPVEQYGPNGWYLADWIFDKNAATYHVLKEHSCNRAITDPLP